VTLGATEAIASAVLGLVSPGDEVAALDPFYDSYPAVARMAGAALRPIALRPPEWRLTADVLAAAIGPRTRVLLINTPHNPTGRVLDEEELDPIASACVEHDLIAVTDEVYEHLVFDRPHVPLATRPGMAERTLTISSVGKTYSFTGWKIGWAFGPPELVAAVRGVKQFLTFAGGTPLQHASAAALRSGIPSFDALRGRRDRLAAGLAQAGFDVLACEGTYFLIVDGAPLGEPDAEALSLRLPDEAGVVAIPVSAFVSDPAGPTRSLLRFTFCKRDDVVDEGVARMQAWAAGR